MVKGEQRRKEVRRVYTRTHYGQRSTSVVGMGVGSLSLGNREKHFQCGEKECRNEVRQDTVLFMGPTFLGQPAQQRSQKHIAESSTVAERQGRHINVALL